MLAVLSGEREREGMAKKKEKKLMRRNGVSSGFWICRVVLLYTRKGFFFPRFTISAHLCSLRGEEA
jgi:hypothetical protein